MKMKSENTNNENKQTANVGTSKKDVKSPLESESTYAVVLDPDIMGAAAALNAGVFSSEYEVRGIPADWKERAQKAWEYYVEEPIVSRAMVQLSPPSVVL